MISVSFFYTLLLTRYTQRSFSSSSFFGQAFENKINNLILQAKNNKSFIIDSVENNKEFAKLQELEGNFKKVERLIILNSIIGNFASQFANFRAKRTFLIFWIYQFLIYILLTVCFFTFLNYQLYNVGATNFNVSNPSVFDFIYYTIKSFTLGDPDNFKPLTSFAKLIQMISFITFGIFFLVFIASISFSMRQEKFNRDISITNEFVKSQNQVIESYIASRYQTDINQVVKETLSIQKSIENIRKLMEKLF